MRYLKIHVGQGRSWSETENNGEIPKYALAD